MLGLYIDDLLVCSTTEEACQQDTLVLFTALAQKETHSIERQAAILSRDGQISRAHFGGKYPLLVIRQNKVRFGASKTDNKIRYEIVSRDGGILKTVDS